MGGKETEECSEGVPCEEQQQQQQKLQQQQEQQQQQLERQQGQQSEEEESEEGSDNPSDAAGAATATAAAAATAAAETEHAPASGEAPASAAAAAESPAAEAAAAGQSPATGAAAEATTKAAAAGAAKSPAAKTKQRKVSRKQRGPPAVRQVAPPPPPPPPAAAAAVFYPPPFVPPPPPAAAAAAAAAAAGVPPPPPPHIAAAAAAAAATIAVAATATPPPPPFPAVRPPPPPHVATAAAATSLQQQQQQQQQGSEGSDPLRELAYFTLLQQQLQQGQQGGSAAASPAAAAAGEAAAGGEDAQLLQQLEFCKDYEDCKNLCSSILSRPFTSPRVVAAAALRLAICGSREFKQQLQQQQQHKQLQKASKTPTSITANTDVPFLDYQFDDRFGDFLQRMRLVLQPQLKQLEQQQQQQLRVCEADIGAEYLTDLLGACALSSVIRMEKVRVLGGCLLGFLQTLNPKTLVKTLSNYTRCMQAEADSKGGINITTEDRHFTRCIVQQLLSCTDNSALAAGMNNRETLKTLNPNDITLLLKACDRLSIEAPELLQHIGVISLKKQNNFTPDAWATVVSVFSRMGIPLRGDCTKQKRPTNSRDWSRPPPPKKPIPISQC